MHWVLSHLNHARFFVTLWTVALQAPLPMGFSRQEYCSGLPCPPSGDLPNQEMEPRDGTRISCIGRRFFTTSTTELLRGRTRMNVISGLVFTDSFADGVIPPLAPSTASWLQPWPAGGLWESCPVAPCSCWWSDQPSAEEGWRSLTLLEPWPHLHLLPPAPRVGFGHIFFRKRKHIQKLRRLLFSLVPASGA